MNILTSSSSIISQIALNPTKFINKFLFICQIRLLFKFQKFNQSISQDLHKQKRFITSALLPKSGRQVSPFQSRITPKIKKPDKLLSRWKKLKKGKVEIEIHDYLSHRMIGKPQNKRIRKMMWFKSKYKNYAPVFIDQFKPQIKLAAAALTEEELPSPIIPEVGVE